MNEWEEKRREELGILWENYRIEKEKRQNDGRAMDIAILHFLDKIILQEKQMIEEVKKKECQECYALGLMGYKPAKQMIREAFQELQENLIDWGYDYSAVNLYINEILKSKRIAEI